MSPLTKQQLRKEIRTLLRNQETADRIQKSSVIQKKLFETEHFLKASVVLFYASFGGEVETFEMMRSAQKAGKLIGLPKTIEEDTQLLPIRVENLDTDLEPGFCGIQEPKIFNENIININEIDLVIVPAVAYDKENYRLGQGAGYYDRFLARLPQTTSTIGLIYDFQQIESLPERSAFDLPVSLVLTNS